MNFIKPENSNLTFRAGDNPSTGDLEVTMAFRPDIPGRAFSVSVWEVSDEDLEEIIRTRRVYLSVMGTGMMPVTVLGVNPFERHGYYAALVLDENGRSKIVDPRAEESFARWVEMLEEQINARPFFKGRNKSIKFYAPIETWRSMYDAGSTIDHTIAQLEKFLEHKSSKQN